MAVAFQRATKETATGKLALMGVSGAGKTYTALRIAQAMGSRIALVDTEGRTARKYSDEFVFDVLELESFHPQNYIDAIRAAEAAGFDVLIIDSLSHAWAGKDGVLEQKDKAAARSKSGNDYVAWRQASPLHNALVDALVQCRIHLIVTMRSKQEYVQEKDDKGRTVIRKVGMAPVQREGLEYEFDVVADLDLDHNFVVTKSRCKALDGYVGNRVGADVAGVYLGWLTDGTPPPPRAAVPPPLPPKKTATPRPTAVPPPLPTEPPPTDGIDPKDPLGLDGYDPQPQPEKPSITDLKFYQAVDGLLQRMEVALVPTCGDAAKAEASVRYHRLLGAEGYEHRSQVPDSQRKAVYRALRAMTEEMERQSGV